MCVCDELAGNRLLNGATAAMWDKIETRETERPIHLLSANQSHTKTTGPFIKPPLTTCRAAHTHTRRHTPLYTSLSLSTFHFWQIFNVKICNMPKLKTFTKFWSVFTLANEAEQLYSVVALSVVIFITPKKSHFANKM